MKLITETLEKRFAEIGDQSEIDNPVIIAKFFNPCGSQTWYAVEYNPENHICYGYVTGMWEDEWGTFSIDELEAVQLPFAMTIERDIYFKEIRFRELIRQQRLEKLNMDHSSKQQFLDLDL
ncbi:MULTISPECIES: DUF2958 domain-containing protein [unclassified Chryseobacterium]|uniref:DUF2958 domain-containing protein n=1 Tax=unclassified Chryseobacterium TaxID=2593645 RepID=UPI000D363ABA|nr:MULTISPECIES: DUF2958 domain-containing protein [unclassified Chryseobacterium]PTT76539.1 hypothetical protein DBR25_05500 [Chryseobacterium sp. HMWF001]PVV55576.1 DUF2958 domain-containing protein [Chryseobacterium sp. HMWF035]